MIDRLLVAALGCAAMAGVAAFELSGDLGVDEVDLPPAARPVETAAAALAPSSPDASVQDVLARPLFTSNRQPSAPRAGKGKTAAEPFKRRLTGVAIGPSTREAVFAGEGSNKPAIVAEGQAIEGWTVETVVTGAVTVRAGSASQLVEIVKPKAAGAAAKAEPRADNNSSAGVSLIRRDR